MFNTIKLKNLEQHTHRFLWRDMHSERNPDHYVLTSVPFGDKPSGAIAMTAKMTKTSLPAAADAILCNAYVDDILPSVSTVEEAVNLTKDIQKVSNSGGFRIKMWTISGLGVHSNSVDCDVKLAENNEGSVLGMIWLSVDDVLKFN